MKWVFIAAGLVAALLAGGYGTQQPWALATWPWVDGRLSNIFVGSIFAAIALPLLWIGWSGRFGGTAGGFLHLGVMLGGAASVLFPFASAAASAGAAGAMSEGRLRAYAAGATLAALACFALAAWAHRQPVRDNRALTWPMRAWFVAYVLILVPGGIALLHEVPGVMPWPLKPHTSQLYGWIFLSATCSFIYPLLRPRAEYAAVGLWGFLAYDLMLLPPFVLHFRAVPPAFQATLWVYASALALIAVISIWYLFVSRRTRLALAPRAV